MKNIFSTTEYYLSLSQTEIYITRKSLFINTIQIRCMTYINKVIKPVEPLLEKEALHVAKQITEKEVGRTSLNVTSSQNSGNVLHPMTPLFNNNLEGHIDVYNRTVQNYDPIGHANKALTTYTKSRPIYTTKFEELPENSYRYFLRQVEHNHLSRLITLKENYGIHARPCRNEYKQLPEYQKNPNQVNPDLFWDNRFSLPEIRDKKIHSYDVKAEKNPPNCSNELYTNMSQQTYEKNLDRLIVNYRDKYGYVSKEILEIFENLKLNANNMEKQLDIVAVNMHKLDPALLPGIRSTENFYTKYLTEEFQEKILRAQKLNNNVNYLLYKNNIPVGKKAKDSIQILSDNQEIITQLTDHGTQFFT